MSEDFGKYLYYSTDRAVEIYENLNQYAVKEIVRRLVKTGYLNKVATNLIYKMQEAGMTMQSIKEEVARHSGMSMKEVSKAFEDAAIEASKEDTETYRQAGLEQSSILTSDVMKNALKTAMLQTNNELRNMTGTMADKSQKIFIDAVDEAYMKVQSGMCTYETAIAEAIRDVSKNGLYVKYSSGRRDTIETAVRRALMTGLNQGTMRMKIEKMKEMGQDLLVTSQHVGARTGGKFPYENHSKWQGKVFSLSGKSDKYPSFVEACGWGKGGGIGGWNCRHHIYAYIEGVSRLPEPIDEKENKRVEELNKKQRRIENSIRSKKRELLGLKEGMKATDNDKLKFELQQQYDRSAYELRELNKKYNDFCTDNNLKTWNERKKIVNFQREQSYEARLGADRYKKDSKNTFRNMLSVGNNNKQFETVKYDIGDVNPDLRKDAVKIFGEEIRNKSEEHAIVIEKTGKVTEFVGDEKSVDIYDVELEGAYVLHNHPVSNGIVSFGKDDLDFMSLHSGVIMFCVNEKYSYYAKVLKSMEDISYNVIYREAMERYGLTDEDMQHCVFEILKERGYVEYERKPIK